MRTNPDIFRWRLPAVTGGHSAGHSRGADGVRGRSREKGPMQAHPGAPVAVRGVAKGDAGVVSDAGTHTTMLGKGMEGSQGACVRRDRVQNQVVRIIGRRGPSASSGQSLDSHPALAGMTFLRGDAGWKAGNPLYSGRYRVRGWDECEVMGPAAKVPSQ